MSNNDGYAPGRWRKKPVVIEAMLLGHPGERWQTVAGWSGATPVKAATGRHVAYLLIPTLEGDMRADFGDYVIRGVKGEFYPCKPDIFAATYEPAEPPHSPPPGTP